MANPEEFGERVEALVRVHNRLLQEHYGLEPLPVGEIVAESVALAQRLRPHLTDGLELVARALAAGQIVLCEGPRGPCWTWTTARTRM